MKILVFTNESEDTNTLTAVRDYNVINLNFSNGVLNINDGEKPLQFKNVKTFNLEI